jgi:hypothetical protein
MKNQTTDENRVVYYWASWKRVLGMVFFIFVVILLAAASDGNIQNQSDIIRAVVVASCGGAFMGVVLGTTFFRIKNNRIQYVSSMFSWSAMDISEIEAITLVPRFFFTNKVTAVQIEKKNHGIFPGMLISRDAFPDETIIALVSHLTHINPSIVLDAGVQKIMESAHPPLTQP